MNYNFYQKCTDMRYYNNNMYISNIRGVISTINKINKHQQTTSKINELISIADYYEL
jgi:hypothetical protein